MSMRLFGTSHEYGSKTAEQIGKLIRGHWTVENLNHWKRDASDWREDRAPKRNPRGAKNLALLRNALLAVIPFEKFSSLNEAFDHYRDHREESLKIIKTAPPCQD
jgi:predicted transposase YbfD/YdcC